MARPSGDPGARGLKRRAGLVLVLSVVVGACAGGGGEAARTSPPGGVLVHLGTGVVEAEVADTPSERRIGLMNRPALSTHAGMLFVFPNPTSSGFWMKNTLVPLSIAFIERTGDAYEVVSVLDMDPCRSDPCPKYRPGQFYELALEVNQGWFARHGVAVGTSVRIVGPAPVPS